VITFVLDKSTNLSSLLILDAQTMLPVVMVPLGTRVPFGQKNANKKNLSLTLFFFVQGFHTTFLSAKDLAASRKNN